MLARHSPLQLETLCLGPNKPNLTSLRLKLALATDTRLLQASLPGLMTTLARQICRQKHLEPTRGPLQRQQMAVRPLSEEDRHGELVASKKIRCRSSQLKADGSAAIFSAASLRCVCPVLLATGSLLTSPSKAQAVVFLAFFMCSSHHSLGSGAIALCRLPRRTRRSSPFARRHDSKLTTSRPEHQFILKTGIDVFFSCHGQRQSLVYPPASTARSLLLMPARVRDERLW